MNLIEIKKIGNKLYYPVFLLEGSISHHFRKILRLVFSVLLFLNLFIIATTFFPNGFFDIYQFILPNFLYGIFYIIFCILVILIISDAFYYSYYFSKPENFQGLFIDFDLARCIYKFKSEDITSSFLSSLLGKKFLMRAGIKDESVRGFLANRTFILIADEFKCDTSDNIINLVDFVVALYEEDSGLKQFLLAESIQKKDLIGISEWIMEAHVVKHSVDRWWAKDNLRKIPSVGEGWSYGQPYNLLKYQRSLPFVSMSEYGIHNSYGEEEIKKIESVLSKNREGNVILVGDDVSGGLQIVSKLNQLISSGNFLPELKAKRIVLFDCDSLVSRTGTKAKFESEFVMLIEEAINAGNIILVINNLPAFISSAKAIDSDVVSLFQPYLSSSELQIIALSPNDLFHRVIEKDSVLMQYFEVVLMKEVDNLNTIKILQNEIVKFEASGIFFTYLALNEIVESSIRYFPSAIMPDKAIDLLNEIIPKLGIEGKKLVEKSDINKLVEEKTGIPLGELGDKEKDKLLNLENILHGRIVGQNEAVSAISSTMRRARSGIESPNRPIGSFLFLGPTGVGKTETTKALADVFFGSSGHIMRLDMSEYSSYEATSKLIGLFENSQPGILSSMIREHPYGVLLLDEFEKTTKEVMNLFLQILDEGFFSDGLGKKVTARNLIIIATSNAGSDIIWDLMKSGKDLAENKDYVINSIIAKGTFKPELLNRFDGVILFHPLSTEDMKKIAGLMLNKLKFRLAEKGMDLIINEPLIDFVIERGADPKFGARPINRAIQEDVEEWIAKSIIAGSIKPGSEIIFKPEDFSN